MDMKIGAAYLRVSTDDQLEYSPDSQLKLIRDYAKREGYMIPDEYVFRDDGISGKSADKRPAFRLMIATAKEDSKSFDAIFVWKYSRFARNQEEAIMYKNLLHKKGVEVKSISEPSSDSPFSSLIERIIEWMDEYYLINLAGEVRRGMKEKSMRGEAMGKPPFGYDVKDKQFIPNDSADVVRWIFDQYASGKTFRAIAQSLSDQGVKLANNQQPNGQAVRYILKNPAYIGKIRWDENGESNYNNAEYFADIANLPDGKHEPIISKETWDIVQKRLISRNASSRYKRENRPVFMLKGLMRCSCCGATLIDITGYARGEHPRMQCYRYGRGQCKESHFITMERANEAVINALEEIIGSQSFVFSPPKPVPSKISRDWDKLISQEQNRLERAKSAMLDGALTSAEFKEIRSGIEDNIEKLKSAKSKESKSVTFSAKSFSPKAIEVLTIIKSPDVSEEAKNEALHSIIEKIVFNKLENTFDIYFLT